MSFKFEKDKLYMMPVFFGPTSMSQKPGHFMPDPYYLEHGIEGEHYAPGDNYCCSISYETDREMLENLVPECYTLREPILSVTVTEFTNLGWMGGNTYNLINITCPVHFKGERDDLDGDLVMVMYENNTDPIVGGRETMGYSKIYCDIPRIAHMHNFEEDKYIATASEFNFRFMKMVIDTKQEAPDADAVKAIEASSAGKMHLKYVPDVLEKEEIGKIPNFTRPAICYPTILPKWVKPADYQYDMIKPEVTWCNGTIEFFAPENWEEFPVYYNVAKTLHDLPVKRVLAAKRIHYTEPCEYCTCYKLR